MTFAEVHVGRLTLAERPGGALEDVAHATTLVRTVNFEGQESAPPLTPDDVAARQDDVLGLMRRIVPIRFGEKSDRDGYFEVVDNNTTVTNWGGEVVAVNWQLRCERHGSDTEVDLESQLSGAQTRVNVHSLVGERWHAPPAGHYAYHTTTGTPSVLTVTGAEGPLLVYRGLTAGVNPRWGCPLDSYGAYRARFLDSVGRERSGYPPQLAPLGWELANGLVRIRYSDSTGLRVAAHDGTGWAEKLWRITVAGTILGAPTSVSVIRNEYEAVTLRLLWPRNPGRTQLDLTLRRGARWVEGYAQTHPGGVSITVGLVTPEATTAPASSGYITASGDDASGDRFLAGSAGAFTADTGASSITRTSTAVMDFLLGAVVGGGAAPSGDQAANHMARYLGSSAEQVRPVRR